MPEARLPERWVRIRALRHFSLGIPIDPLLDWDLGLPWRSNHISECWWPRGREVASTCRTGSSASSNATTISARGRSGTSRRAGSTGSTAPGGGSASRASGACDPRTGKVETWSLDRDVGAHGAARATAARCSPSTTASILRFRQRQAGAASRRRGRSAAHPPQRRQVRPARPLLRRRHGRQGGAQDLRALSPRPGPHGDQGRRGHHLLQRAVLEPGRQDLLPRRHLPGGVLGLRLRHRDRHARAIAGCSPPRATTPASPTARPSTPRATCGTPR